MIKKITALALATLLSTSVLTSCSKKKDKENDSGADSKIVAPVVDTVSIDGETVKVENMLSINGVGVPADAYRYVFLLNKNAMDKGDSTYWTSNPDKFKELKETTLENILEIYWPNAVAKDLDITLAPEDLTAIDTQISSAVTQYGSEDVWQTTLKENNLNSSLYKELMKTNSLAELIFDSYYGEKGTKLLTNEELKSIINKDYVRVVHTLINFDHYADDEDYADKTEKEQEEAAKKLAEQVLEDALAKRKTVFELAAEFGDDPGMTSADGYYFTKGQMVKPFEEASFSLKDNEIADKLIESTYGYHIIQRLPLEDKYIDDNIATLKKTHYANVLFLKDIDEAKAGLDITFDEVYDKLTIDSIS